MITYFSILLTIIIIITSHFAFKLIRLYIGINKIIKSTTNKEYVEPNINMPISKGNIPKDKIDHIIIGSGPSGLTAAALLSKLGLKCVVLE